MREVKETLTLLKRYKKEKSNGKQMEDNKVIYTYYLMFGK